MDLFQEYFVTAMVALIFSCIIVKLVSAAVSNDGKKIDHKEKVVVKEAKITKGLVVRSRKRVKFVDQEVVGNVDHIEGMPCKVGGVVVDQSENAGENKVSLEKKVFVEKKIEGIIKKGDDFKGEKVLENLDLIEHCGGEREVIDGHDDADMCSKIGLLEERDEVNKIEKTIEDILKKGDDFKEEKLLEYLNLIEQCDGHEDKYMSSKIGLLEERDEVKKIDELVVVKEKDIVNISVVDQVKLGENEVVEGGEGLSKKTDKKVTDEDSDDDWEGIERSELEEEFVKAVNFVDGENLGSELMLQLYGFQKIAMEGPCHEPQPMALKVYARAKWNAWQKMGSMKPEVAMEQYIKLLSDHVPRWTHHTKDDCGISSSETKMPGEPDYIPNSINDISKDERTRDMNHAAEGGDFSGGEKDKEFELTSKSTAVSASRT